MKSTHKYLVIILLFVSFALASCGSSEREKLDITKIEKNVNETELLYNFLEKSGNYINKKSTPNIIPAEKVYQNLKKYHVIDIRKASDYVVGHIDGAVNVKLSELVDYMANDIEAANFEKIIIVCYSGQKAGYATAGLRLLGYSNVYSMKWGMSAWDKNTAAKKWGANTSSKYVAQLQTDGNPKGEKTNLPEIKTGKKTGQKILEARIKAILENPKFKKKADDVFNNTNVYYIINYWKTDDYIKGHIPGAVQYPPKASFTRETFLSTLPMDKPIVIYCYTGQHAAYVAAYLRILGYDAYSMAYGANAIMHSKLKAGIGHAFGNDQIKNYPMISGDKPSLELEGAADTQVDDTPVAAPVIINNNSAPEEEGGC